MHFPGGSEEFFGGNGRFITRRLWGVGNTGPYFHHGLYATMRERRSSPTTARPTRPAPRSRR